MAKTRHSTALFEVIASGQPIGAGRPGMLRSISRWFSSRAAAPTMPPVQRSVPGLAPPADNLIESTPPPLEYATPEAEGSEIAIRLSYAGAAIALVALVTVVGAAFIAGKSMGARAASSAGPFIAPMTSEQLRASEPTPSVLQNVVRTNVRPPAQQPAENTSRVQQALPANPLDPMQPVRGANRRPGLNYVIIQSYPEKKMAEEAVKTLGDQGIVATVERNLPRWGISNWYIVVGTDGFARMRDNPVYAAYIKKIEGISEEYRKKRGSFRAFEPKAYKWAAK